LNHNQVKKAEEVM